MNTATAISNRIHKNAVIGSVVSLFINAIVVLGITLCVYGKGGFVTWFAIVAMAMLGVSLALSCKNALTSFVLWHLTVKRNAIAANIDLLQHYGLPCVDGIPYEQDPLQYLETVSLKADIEQEGRRAAAMLFGYYSAMTNGFNATANNRNAEVLAIALASYMAANTKRQK